MQRHIAEYKALLATDPQPPANLSGDGVLYAMFEDNNRADLGILVGLKMLREVGWQGRVQLWHVGHHPAIDAGLDVEIIDAREVQRRHGGYIQILGAEKFLHVLFGFAARAVDRLGCLARLRPGADVRRARLRPIPLLDRRHGREPGQYSLAIQPGNPPGGLRRQAFDRPDSRGDVPAELRDGMEAPGAAALPRHQLGVVEQA